MALIRALTSGSGGGGNKLIGVLDDEYDTSDIPVEITCPISCNSFQIITTDTRSSILAELKVNGTAIPSASYTTEWSYVNTSFAGRMTVNYSLYEGDVISYKATSGTFGGRSVVVMFIE